MTGQRSTRTLSRWAEESPESGPDDAQQEVSSGFDPADALGEVSWKVKPGRGGVNDLLGYQCDPKKTLRAQVVTTEGNEVVAANIANATKVLAKHSIDLVVDRTDVAVPDAPANDMPAVCDIVAKMGSPKSGQLPVLFLPLGTVDKDGGINGFYEANLQSSCESSPFKSVAIVGTKTSCSGTMLHEIGHAAGNGHVGGRGDEDNVMNGCRPGADRSTLNVAQVRRFCRTEF